MFRDRFNLTGLAARVAKPLLEQLASEPGALSQGVPEAEALLQGIDEDAAAAELSITCQWNIKVISRTRSRH